MSYLKSVWHDWPYADHVSDGLLAQVLDFLSKTWIISTGPVHFRPIRNCINLLIVVHYLRSFRGAMCRACEA